MSAWVPCIDAVIEADYLYNLWGGWCKLIEDDLRAAGLRVTKARVMVLAVFHRASLKQHLTAEDVYRELLTHEGSVGLGTIYSCLLYTSPSPRDS